MTDRELLELAAKAAGRTVGTEDDCDPIDRKFDNTLGLWCAGPWSGWFNPLNDDGDALRLAVQCDITIDINRIDGVVTSEYGYSERNGVQENCDHEPYAATRRAIVRAAAEIGKAK